MRLSRTIVEKMQKLAEGEALPASQLQYAWAREMLRDGILAGISSGRGRKCRVVRREAFMAQLSSSYGINDLPATLKAMRGGASRAEQAAAGGNSKLHMERSMTGFLVNTVTPLPARLNNKDITINPHEGSFIYIYDYETFEIPDDVLVVGIENAWNFRHVQKQRHLFPENENILYICRYPQNGDLARWLLQIPNRYLHFGDFDLAGINIYLTEIYSKIKERASFYIPGNIEELLRNGSPERYNDQYEKFYDMQVADSRVRPLVELINKYRRCFDQEGLI